MERIEDSSDGLFVGSAGIGAAAVCVGPTTGLGAAAASLSFLLALCGVERNAESGGRLTSLWKGYVYLVRQGVSLLRCLGWTSAASIFGGLCGEPLNAVHAGFHANHTAQTPLRLWGLNPDHLSVEQQQNSPILLFAGKLANPGVMADLARVLSAHPERRNHPLFLCDWGGCVVNEVAQQAIWNRMAEIEKLYPEGKPVQWTLIGHSWGGWAAAVAGLEGLGVGPRGPRFDEVARLDLRPNVSRLIMIGHPLTAEVSLDKISEELLQRLYEVDADWDVLVDQRSVHPDQYHRGLVACGHLGLIQLASATGRVAAFAGAI